MATVHGTCLICGAPFTGHHTRKYCGAMCKGVADVRNRSVSARCEHCHTEFRARRSNNARFCSRACAATYNNKRRFPEGERESGPLTYKVDPLKHIGLVATIAKRFIKYRLPRYGNVPIDQTDEFQDGCIGLLYACARFDATKGVRFSTWAWQYIRGYILTGKRKKRRSPDGEVALCARMNEMYNGVLAERDSDGAAA